jgi:ribulose-5-phosphate 4-epimerase/fuculose-1-phosphate aldolase
MPVKYRYVVDAGRQRRKGGILMTDRVPLNPFEERSLDEERRHRKQRLAAAFRIFGRLGFDEGVAGHITARDPEHSDRFWVNPFGMSFKQIRVRDLLLVDHAGTVLEGSWPVNPAAFAIHSQVHAARPDVIAAAHSHSVHGKAFASLHRSLRPLTQDACIFFEDHGVYFDFGGVANDPEEGKRIAAALGDYKAAITTMERTCQAELLAMAAGNPVEIPDQIAHDVHAEIGSPLAGWYSAQPLFAWIVATEPDCLEER